MASNNNNGLRAGAVSFTPMAPAGTAAGDVEDYAPPLDMNDSFAEHVEMIDTLEQEIEAAAPYIPVAATAAATSTARVETGLPSHMKAHAAEFWFPECRDCTCCKGFKHGCTCSPSNYGVCSVCSGVQTAPPPSAAPPVSAASAPPSAYSSNKSPCKFFSSPRGCRFGDKCRFAHS